MRNFNDAIAKLNGRDSRKVDNNTYLERLSPDEIGVRLHNTYVVRYFRNGSVTIHSGGWHTVTTKDRINSYSPASVTQRKYEWFCNGVPFTEGMEVGTPQAVEPALF